MENELEIIKSAENGNEIPNTGSVRFLIGDVRDKERVLRAMEGIDVVFNVAAMKHVPACEYNPFEAVKTNVLGLQNLIEAALKTGIETVVYSSTDKAASSTNIVLQLNSEEESKRPNLSAWLDGFSITRGSVPRLFGEHQKVTLTYTEPEMTRFAISEGKSVELILKAATESVGGEIFVLKMPAVRMGDVAKSVMEYFNWLNEDYS